MFCFFAPVMTKLSFQQLLLDVLTLCPRKDIKMKCVMNVIYK